MFLSSNTRSNLGCNKNKSIVNEKCLHCSVLLHRSLFVFFFACCRKEDFIFNNIHQADENFMSPTVPDSAWESVTMFGFCFMFFVLSGSSSCFMFVFSVSVACWLSWWCHLSPVTCHLSASCLFVPRVSSASSSSQFPSLYLVCFSFCVFCVSPASYFFPPACFLISFLLTIAFCSTIFTLWSL